MRPIVGITGNFGPAGCELAEAYYLSVERAGAVPFIIPPSLNFDDEGIERALDGIDALLLSGGADINPLLLGEEPMRGLGGINVRRDAFELALVRRAFQRQMPILGICRGVQVLAAALGGRVIQDIYSEGGVFAAECGDGSVVVGSDCRVRAGGNGSVGACGVGRLGSGCRVPLLKHSQEAERWCATHSVDICEGTLLHSIFRTGRMAVNSYHHQAVGEPGRHLRVCATAPDGVVEAVESTERKPVLGVQWHPESFELVGDHVMMPLFGWLAEEAELYRRTLELHERVLTLDSHEDTPMFFDQNIHFGERDPRILVNLPNMEDGHLDCGIQVAYQAQGALDEDSLVAATDKANALLDGIEAMVEPLAGRVAVVKACDKTSITAQVLDNKRRGRRSILLGIENGYAFGSDIANVERFRRRGVVYCTLCHNGCNQVCDSAKPKAGDRLWGGLSPFGREVVREMDRVGMTIDLSHAAESTFYETLELATRPVVCSHSNARALCDHPRNLTDDQMRALAAKGGVAQVTLYEGFLRNDGKATIDDVMRHLEHAIEVMGIDHVGIGTDLDGDGGVPGVANAGELCNITRELLRRGYPEEDIAKIWGGNFLRVLES